MYCIVFVFLFCFFEIYRIDNPQTKATIMGAMAKLESGVTAKTTARIAAIKPRIINSFLIA